MAEISCPKDRAEKLAWFYVYKTNGNKTHAYRLYRASIDDSFVAQDNDWATAVKMFRKEEVIKAVHKYYEENRKLYALQRDKNIQALNGVVEDPDCSRKDRIAAVKELNNMFGYNSSNINVNGKANIEVVIE